nr:hypothetical protein Iba_chr02fCG9020 [Ipomoea batatas]
MPSENNCIIEDVDNEVNFLNPYDFNDSDSFDSSDDDDENCVDTCENNSFVSLDNNDVLESFTFDDESLSNELTNDLHEICGDDDVNIEASLCDLNDIECVTFHDNCLDDALYIHDLIGKDRSEESVTIEKENEEEHFENEKVLFEEVHGKIIEEEKEKTRNESVREEVEDKMPPKTRYKEMAKKSRHDVGGSSSGAAAAQCERVAPGDRAMGHLSYLQRARVEELAEKQVSGGLYFDFPLLDSYGCREERDDTYVPVVYEFIATFSATDESSHSIPSIKFTVFGQEHHLSVDQLGTYLGFYTQDHMNEEDYRNLPNDLDSDATVEAYWHRISGGNEGRRMDFQDEALARHNEALERQNEAFARQEARQNQQLDAIEQIRLWRSRDSHPPRRVGTVLTELLGLYLGYGRETLGTPCVGCRAYLYLWLFCVV